MKSSLIRFVLALILAAVQASAANFSGKWNIPATGPRRGPTVLVLNQVGTRITGYIIPPRGVSTGSPANADVLGGKAEGESISFYLWTGLDKPLKSYYKGTMSGDEIVLTVTTDSVAGAQQGNPVQVTAKRIE